MEYDKIVYSDRLLFDDFASSISMVPVTISGVICTDVWSWDSAFLYGVPNQTTALSYAAGFCEYWALTNDFRR